MKAAVLEAINAPLTVADVGLTELLFGQVLVKVLVSGICGSQLQEIGGHKGNAAFLPHLMGHEGCGIVEDIGAGVTKVKKGDKVVMHWRKGDGIESDFPSYIFNGKVIKSGKVTTFSEYSIVSENRITPVPQDTPEELCALLGCSLSTALGTVNLEANLKMGEGIMIVGAGGLGVNLIKAAKMVSAYPIISVDIHDSKKAVAEQLGADLYINGKHESIKEALHKAFGIKEVDVIIDTSGSPRSIEETLQLLSGTGRFIMVGQPKPGETVELKNANHFFGGSGKMIKATQGGQFSPSIEIPRYIKLYQSGLLNIDNLITHRVPIHKINEAIDLVRKGEASRILIDLQPSPLLRAYTKMSYMRAAEEEIAQLYLKHKIMSFVHFYVGQEAVATGVCDALQPQDKVMGNHRSHGHYLAKGGDLRAMVREMIGKEGGVAHGKGGSMHMIDKSVNFVGSTPILGSAVPLAAGSAFAQAYNHQRGISVAFVGDGASEEGGVYETLNLSALFKLPLLLVVENNLYSVNSKLKDRRSPKYDVEHIVTGFGVQYKKADGNDYEDVLAKAKELVASIRKTKTPAVLECMTYRHMAHSAPLFDDAQGYREEDTPEVRSKNDSIKRLRQTLLTQGVTEETLAQIDTDVRAQVLAAIDDAQKAAYPNEQELTTHVYA